MRPKSFRCSPSPARRRHHPRRLRRRRGMPPPNRHGAEPSVHACDASRRRVDRVDRQPSPPRCAIDVVGRGGSGLPSGRQIGKVHSKPTLFITRGGRGRCLRRSRAPRGLREWSKASEIASVSYRVRAVAAGVSRAGLLEILWSRRKFSLFCPSGAATRRHQ